MTESALIYPQSDGLPIDSPPARPGRSVTGSCCQRCGAVALFHRRPPDLHNRPCGRCGASCDVVQGLGLEGVATQLRLLGGRRGYDAIATRLLIKSYQRAADRLAERDTIRAAVAVACEGQPWFVLVQETRRALQLAHRAKSKRRQRARRESREEHQAREELQRWRDRHDKKPWTTGHRLPQHGGGKVLERRRPAPVDLEAPALDVETLAAEIKSRMEQRDARRDRRGRAAADRGQRQQLEQRAQLARALELSESLQVDAERETWLQAGPRRRSRENQTQGAA